MLKQLKFKNTEIPGFFISDEGKIYDSNGVEQEQHICPSSPYYRFKGHSVHIMMCHSFYRYKKGFDAHHKNRMQNE